MSLGRGGVHPVVRGGTPLIGYPGGALLQSDNANDESYGIDVLAW